jgi:hypothetical protein
MSPLVKRLAAWSGLMFLTGTLACAQGAPADPLTKIEIPTAPPEILCGNGKMDPGEQCDCTNMSASGQCKVDGVTCAMFKGPMSTGTVLCNAKPLCTLNLDMCSGGPTGAMGGTGAMMITTPGAGGAGATTGAAATGSGSMTSGVTGTGGTGRR